MVGSWLRIYAIAQACIAIGRGVEGFSGMNIMNGVRNMVFTNCQGSRLMGEKEGGEGMDLECSKGVNEVVDLSRLGVSMKKNNEVLLQEPHGGKLVNLMVQSEAEKQVRESVVVIAVLRRSNSTVWVIVI